MIIVRVLGGLGNQMFDYAIYYSLRRSGKEVYFDDKYLNYTDNPMLAHSVFDVFNLERKVAPQKLINKYSNYGTNPFSRICRRIGVKKKSHVFESFEGHYDKTVFDLDNVYLDGYWQTEKYFCNYRRELLECFKPALELSDKSKEIALEIETTENPVSIHVRLGDYGEGLNKKLYGGICTIRYYLNAIEFFYEKYQGVKFFLFSNEPNKVESILGDRNTRVVDCNGEMDGWMDMVLMSKCKHHIIANSSFSWWGAWLCENTDHRVIAPKKWINGRILDEICPDHWIRMEG